MQFEPGLDLLIEDDPHDHVAAVAEHRHEAPRLAQRLGGRIVELADVAEVDLRRGARCCLDRNCNVLRLDPSRPLEGFPEPLDRWVRAAEVGILAAKSVVDGAVLQPLRHEGLDAPRKRSTVLACCGATFGG